jgi:hypothetical protein
MHAFAGQVLRDLARWASDSPGLAAGLHGLAARLGIDLPLKHDPAFELLYPPVSEDADHGAIAALAAEWAKGSPEAVADLLAFYQAEASRIGHQWTPAGPELCRLVAGSVEAPERWLHAFQGRKLKPDFSAPFLSEIVSSKRPGWQQELEDCLASADLRWEATSLLLRLTEPPESLLAQVLEKQLIAPTLAETLSLRKEVPIRNLRALLQHPDWEVALAAAVGEWYGAPHTPVRTEVLPEWRAAVIRAGGVGGGSRNRYWLGRILASDAALAFDWLEARLSEPCPSNESYSWVEASPDAPADLALKALSRNQRLSLLDQLGSREASDRPAIVQYLLPRLVERDKALYCELLKKEELKEFFDTPLSGPPDKTWEELAVMALGAGLDAERVAAASLWSTGIISPGGDELRLWQNGFARLASYSRPDLQRVGQHGQVLLQGRIDFLENRRKQVDLHELE